MKTIVEINSLRVEKLNNDEFTQFIKSAINLMEDATLEKLNINQEWITTLKKHTEDLTEASRQSRYSAETQNINAIDRKRTKLLALLLSDFRNERNHINASRQEAANYLYKVTRNFAGTQRVPLRQKSQTISALIKDLKKPQEQTHLQTLGLAEVVEKLNEYNQECQTLIESRAETQVSEEKINTKQVRLAATKLYRDLTKYAFATNLLHPTTESGNFITLLNKLISDTAAANKQRRVQTSSKPPKQVG